MTKTPMARHELKAALSRALEGIEDEELEQEDLTSTTGEPHALNSDGLLSGLCLKLNIPMDQTITSRDRGLDNPL